MKKQFLLALFAVIAIGQEAKAISCATLDGKDKLRAWWGHGRGGVVFVNKADGEPFEGTLEHERLNPSVRSLTIPGAGARLTLMIFENENDQLASMWVGILDMGRKQEFLNCKYP